MGEICNLTSWNFLSLTAEATQPPAKCCRWEKQHRFPRWQNVRRITSVLRTGPSNPLPALDSVHSARRISLESGAQRSASYVALAYKLFVR